MPGYDYEAVRKDPKKQQEILNFCTAFWEFMEDNLASEQKEGFSRREQGAFEEAIDDLEKTMRGDLAEREITFDNQKNVSTMSFDFDMALTFMRGRLVRLDSGAPKLFEKMKKSIPGANRFLKGIEMPERGTAGYVFDRSRDFLMYDMVFRGKDEQRIMDGQASQIHIATAYALQEACKGARDWRKVRISDEELSRRRTEIAHDIDGTSTLGNMLTQKDKGAGQLCSTILCGEPEDLEETINARYCSEILPDAVQEVRQEYTEYLKKDGTKSHEAGFVEIAIPTLIKEALAASDPEKYKTFQDLDQEERKYRQLYGSIYRNTSAKDLSELVTGDPTQLLDKVLEIAVPAKERIEALQEKLKTEKNAEKKLRLTAEIIATRELAGVQRGGKGLENYPAPDAVAVRTQELAAEMRKVRKRDPKAMDKLVAQATSGHGGKMMEAYNKAAQPTRERRKPVPYIDYINKLDLEKASSMDVAKLIAATSLFITQEKGAQAMGIPEEIDTIAEKINSSSAFQNIMKDPRVIQNARMGLGLAVAEQLNKQQQAELRERDRKQAERDKDTIRENETDPEWRKNRDKDFLLQLKHQGEWKQFNSEARQNAQNYLESSPGCRAEAMEIIAKYNLKGLWVPKLCEMPDEQLNDPAKHKAALQKQQKQEKQPEPVKQEKSGAELGGVGK